MFSSKRSCLNDPNLFCYICGEYTIKKCRKPITKSVQSAYFAYFNMEIKDLDKHWIPSIVCKMCSEHLRQWNNGKRRQLKFGVPMVWREPKNHYDDCYFCLVKLRGVNRKKMIYPDLESAKRPLPHSEDVPVPTLGDLSDLSSTESTAIERSQGSTSYEKDSDFEATSSKPILFTQAALSDLIRDLDLSKERSELLASRLKERNLLSAGTKVTCYRTREKELLQFFLLRK